MGTKLGNRREPVIVALAGPAGLPACMALLDDLDRAPTS